MNTLIGSTGFVGGHLRQKFDFDLEFNSRNISEISGLETDLLICAGLPAEKWKANNNPEADWSNIINLAQILTSVKAKNAILISTVDVYNPAIGVTEEKSPDYGFNSVYGRNRAWFEAFFSSQFQNTTIIRLPGLFASDLKKNFIYDLIHRRNDQILSVNRESKFQFFDITKIGEIIYTCKENRIRLLNVATEPVMAIEVADIFGVELQNKGVRFEYDFKTSHATIFNRSDGYIQSKEDVLLGIRNLSKIGH